MKEIKAYIKAFKRDDVTRALHTIEGLEGATMLSIVGITDSGYISKKG